MKSPFPGMDPYLEDPSIWPNVHSRLINVASELLSRDVGPNYFVGIEERLYLTSEVDPGRESIVPDLYVKPLPGVYPNIKPAGGTIAVAEPIDITLLDPEVHELRLELMDTRTRAVVTVIEFLSPANKVSKSEGRRSYMEKRDQVYASQAHWIEIDLLRAGETTFRRWAGTRSDYGAHLSRRIDPQRRRSMIWPVKLPQRLPPIPVPLKAGDPDVGLDLQAVFDLVYERGTYDRTIDYSKEPVVPLADDAHRWARHLLDTRDVKS